MFHQMRPATWQARLPPVAFPDCIEADWNGGDAFRPAWCDALSLSLPVAESYCIRSLQAGLNLVPASHADAGLANAVRLFCEQETAHSRIHLAYNRALAGRGVTNGIGPRVSARFARVNRRVRALGGDSIRFNVAVTAALEHWTTLLGHLALTRADCDGDPLFGAREPMQMIWRWHAAEELEHCAVALDLYRAIGGKPLVRRTVFLFSSLLLFSEVARQTIGILRQGGNLRRWRTWLSAGRFLLGIHGLAWDAIPHALAYLRPGFQAGSQDDRMVAQRWLSEHAQGWEIGGPIHGPVAMG